MKSAEGARRTRQRNNSLNQLRSSLTDDSGSIVALIKPHTAYEYGESSPLRMNKIKPQFFDEFPMPSEDKRIVEIMGLQEEEEEEKHPDYTYEEYDVEVDPE